MKQVIEHIDNELFARLAQGDEEAFRQIVHFFYKKMLPLTISLVKSASKARDIMQEVFLKLWLNRVTLTSIENPAAWLNVVVSNTTSNYMRAQIRYELRIKNLLADTAETEEIWGDLDAKFTQALIDEAVSQLPAKRKQVFLLSRREGLSRKEIASRMNISENTVRNQLAEAIQFIQDNLKHKGALVIISIILQSEIK
ncbi:MAG: sigma-70 family RNA polymerase sigma factor [Chitinophagaceae bacterium]